MIESRSNWLNHSTAMPRAMETGARKVRFGSEVVAGCGAGVHEDGASHFDLDAREK